MKKEPLSIIIVKTLLIVAIFTGVGTIIFGGGVLIMKFHNSEMNSRIVKPVDQEIENYYNLLENKCAGDSCCLSSLGTMKQGGYMEADENGNCSNGFKMNMQKCITTFQWCEPIEKIDQKDCDQDSDCVETQADCCSCSSGGKQIGINKKYLKNWEDALEKKCQDIGCIALFNCKEGKVVCKNNKCEFKEELDDNNQSDTSDWQTYRNEEFGFEFKYPREWKQFTDFPKDFPKEFQEGDRWVTYAMVYNGKYNSFLYGDGPGPGNLNFKAPQAAIDSSNLGDDATFPMTKKNPLEYKLLCPEKQIITRNDGLKIETCDFRVYQGEIKDYSIKPFCIQNTVKRSCIFLYTTTQLNEMTDYKWNQFKPYVGFDINKQLEEEYKNISNKILSTFRFIEK